MSFAPGEAYQFDWSHETITLAGLPLTVKAAHMKLSHSRMPFVRVYFHETQELVFDAHDKAFRFYGGVCRRGIYDNMKTAVEAIFDLALPLPHILQMQRLGVPSSICKPATNPLPLLQAGPLPKIRPSSQICVHLA
jgi:transposase